MIDPGDYDEIALRDRPLEPAHRFRHRILAPLATRPPAASTGRAATAVTISSEPRQAAARAMLRRLQKDNWILVVLMRASSRPDTGAHRLRAERASELESVLAYHLLGLRLVGQAQDVGRIALVVGHDEVLAAAPGAAGV